MLFGYLITQSRRVEVLFSRTGIMSCHGKLVLRVAMVEGGTVGVHGNQGSCSLLLSML